MPLSETELDSFGSLSRALGITTETGTNAKWFTDPVGGSAQNPNGLKTVLRDDAQRQGLLDFVDDVLGPPEGRTSGDTRWVPLFHASDPEVTIHAVVEVVAGAVHLGVGLDFDTGATAPLARIRLHVPLFRLGRDGPDPFPETVPDLPPWLLVGNRGGRITIGCEAVFTEAPPVPREAFLRGVTVQAGIPTHRDDDLAFSLELTGLQLPGATTPTTRTLASDDLGDLGGEVLDFVVGLVRAQVEALDPADAAFTRVRGVAGLLGLRDVDGLPALPLADLATRGADALVSWLESIVGSEPALTVWLAQLVDVVGGAPDPALGAVRFAIADVSLLLGLRVAPGTGGHPVLVPWVRLAYDTRAGAQVGASLDLLRLDTGTGGCVAVPALRAEAVFGDEAGGPALLTGATALGGLRLGVGRDDAGAARFVLTAHHVLVAGHPHEVLDLSSPDAALDAVDAVVDAALLAALHQLGAAGDLLVDLLGVEAIAVADLVANPLGALRAHYAALLADAGDAAALWGHLRALLTGAPDVPVAGLGTVVSPWRIDVLGGVGLEITYAADVLRVTLGTEASVDFTGDLAARVTASVALLSADLLRGRVVLSGEVAARLTMAPVTGDSASLSLGVADLAFARVGVGVRWSAASGLVLEPVGDGLTLTARGTAAARGLAVPLPRWSASGGPGGGPGGDLEWAPDWDDIETLLVELLGHVDAPAVRVPLDLLGWSGAGAHLGLGDLIADPVLAIEAWLAGLALDCGHVEAVLRPVAVLLSGGTLEAPLGRGRPESPYRCPVAGDPRAPALVAWSVPGCPPPQSSSGPTYAGRLEMARDGQSLVDALAEAAVSLPEVADLLVGRPRLGEGLDSLVVRWAGTDGVIGPPEELGSLPGAVTGVVLTGLGDGELTAGARTGQPWVLDGLAASTASVVHVGVASDWLAGTPPSTGIDATAAAPAELDPTAPGTWFVRVADPRSAAAGRPDHDGVAGQTEQLAAVLAYRSAPIILVAHGASGAAAVRVASLRPAVSAVVTVGTPWSGVGLAGLRTGLAADALSFLSSIAPGDLEAWPELLVAQQSTPLVRGVAMVRHAEAVVAPTDLPSAEGEVLRPGLEVRAVFGAVDEVQARDVVRAVVAAGVSRLQAASDVLPTGLPQELDLGLDVPVLDLDLGGVFVGAGAALTLLRLVARPDEGPALEVTREVTVTARFGVTDGWLVGGPGAAQRDVEARWAEVRVHVPLDGSAGSSEVVLHDARCFDVSRVRWVVRAGADLDLATAALPEARIVIGQVVGRVIAASPDLTVLLDLLGVTRDGGLDPAGLDHLLFDPATTFRARIAAAPDRVAATLRAFLPDVGEPTGPGVVTLGAEGARVLLDLATGAVSASAEVTTEGLPTLSVVASADGTGADLSLTWGGRDASSGGVGLVGTATTRGAGAALRLEVHAPGGADGWAAAPTTVALWPALDPGALAGVLRALVPAAAFGAVLDGVRQQLSTDAGRLVDGALTALGLAPTEGGAASTVLPFGLFADPVAWLSRRVDPFAAAVAAFDALAPIVAPARGAAPGWPVADGFTITYAVVAGRLELRAALDLDAEIGAGADAAHLAGSVVAGLSVGREGPPQPLVDAEATVDGYGLALHVTPGLGLSLVRPAPAARMSLYPSGPGVGEAVLAGAESLLTRLLDELMGHRDDTGSALVKDVAAVVHDVLLGLALLTPSHGLDVAAVRLLAASPASSILDRVPGLVSVGLGSLARGLDPTGAVVAVSSPSPTRRSFVIGGDVATITLDAAAPSITFAATVVIGSPADPVGRITLHGLTLGPAGLLLDVVAGPFVLDLGTFTLRPLVAVRAGVTPAGVDRAVGIGVSLDESGTDSVEFRWTLDGRAPVLAAVERGPAAEDLIIDPVVVGTRLLGVALSIASGILADQLGPVVSDRAVELLQGVVLAGGDLTIDPGLGTDLLDGEAMLARLERLAFNCATATVPLSVTIDETVTISLVGPEVSSGVHRLGLALTLAGGPVVLADGDVTVALVADNAWIHPTVTSGLTIDLLEGTATDLVIAPGFAIGGVGLRFGKAAGPLLDLGSIALDGIEVNVYAEATSSGVGGGARLKLDGLAVAPGGGGGDNGVANAMMNDAGSASVSNRPAFSPSVAVQKHPGAAAGFSLTAGDPPGPWWISIQRQLGPLYVERVGLNSVENDGRVVKISLLFTGQVSLFGLTAAVDELSINWNGGDVLLLRSWSVDLAGLAISAEMAGLSLSGGLLKTEAAGSVSYVGMLVGRFAAYGLSVFGGYTNDHGNASFFVFGAVNGPIGGPPAFFVTGLGGGLGINRGLKVPDDISRFGEYPFIQALDPGARPPDNPMDELRRLSEYFPHQMGNFWFAAGISFTCFALVDGVAVVAVSFGDGLEITLFGLARMALPRPGAALVSIELALLARFSTREGVFMIKAQLTDNSWLLYEDVRLTGGFAFAIWWKGPLAGQFVLSIGGYHPDFHRDGYPVVPRLGIHWQVSDAIVIKGGSYFALTSEALMAGTDVEASADFGWAWARVAFGAHGIIYFDPFWFEVRAYARISAGIDIDLGFFGSISISLSLGAQIKVWGPDFAGEATFEVGPCEITVGFGSSRRVEPAVLDWTQFVTKYLEDGGGGRARALSGITGRGTLPTATGGRTGAPSADGSRGLPFRVYAEFELSLTTTIPTTGVAVGAVVVGVPTVRSDGAAMALGLAPMAAQGLASVVTIALKRWNDSTRAWEEPAADALPGLGANILSGAKPDGSRLGSGSFPLGVWGPPLALGLPVTPLPKGDIVNAGNLVTLVAVPKMPAVGPEILYRQVTSKRRPLPLQATGAERSDFLRVARDLDILRPVSVTASFALARAALFPADGAGTSLAEGALPVGRQSALSRATFTRDRAAPPIFGSLADGLAAVGAAAGEREELGLPVPPEAAPPRRPEVVAHLTSGIGAVVRETPTTVSDARLARRPAPTTESVRGRLGLHLPVVLARTGGPGLEHGGTVVGVGPVPRTDVVGAVRTYAGSRVGSPGLQELVGGLGGSAGLVPGSPRDRAADRALARELSTGRRSRAATRSATSRDVPRRPRDASGSTGLRPGDVVVLESPDAAIDVDAQRRPRLVVTGRARVVAVAGRVATTDLGVVDGEQEVPAGTTHVVVQADGDPSAAGGLAGWHDRSRVARLGSHLAIAAGCVVSVDAAGGGEQLGWATAGDLVREADEVTTRFSRPVTTVAIVLAGATARVLEPTSLHLIGAAPVLDHGRERPPTVVTLGAVTVLVHDVVPDPGSVAVTVTVRLGADWTLAGVLGGTEAGTGPGAVLAERLARVGVAASTTSLLAADGPGCTVAWRDAPPAPRRAVARVRRARGATRGGATP